MTGELLEREDDVVIRIPFDPGVDTEDIADELETMAENLRDD